jgi:hypothetical protein
MLRPMVLPAVPSSDQDTKIAPKAVCTLPLAAVKGVLSETAATAVVAALTAEPLHCTFTASALAISQQKAPAPLSCSWNSLQVA